MQVPWNNQVVQRNELGSGNSDAVVAGTTTTLATCRGMRSYAICVFPTGRQRRSSEKLAGPLASAIHGLNWF